MKEPATCCFFNTWGGGGWGDPYERDPALVALEVERGLVTRAGAERYGVVLRDDLTVDEEATAALRDKLRAARGEVKLFDRGGTVEELRERCLEETSLEPPKPPEFNRRVLRFLQEREAGAAKAGAAAE